VAMPRARQAPRPGLAKGSSPAGLVFLKLDAVPVGTGSWLREIDLGQTPTGPTRRDDPPSEDQPSRPPAVTLERN